MSTPAPSKELLKEVEKGKNLKHGAKPKEGLSEAEKKAYIEEKKAAKK